MSASPEGAQDGPCARKTIRRAATASSFCRERAGRLPNDSRISRPDAPGKPASAGAGSLIIRTRGAPLRSETHQGPHQFAPNAAAARAILGIFKDADFRHPPLVLRQ